MARKYTSSKGYVPPTETEDGFRAGMKARVNLPGDQWDGLVLSVIEVRSERTAGLTKDGHYGLYCVAALQHV